MSYDIYIVEPTKYRGGEIMAQKKFLVTGATGDTGGYTVEQLLERGHAVRALAHREDDRSTYFAEWLLYRAPMIWAGVLHVPFGTGRHAPIAAEDQARVIVGILQNPNPHRGQVYPLYGPVEFTYAEIAQVLSRVLGWEVQYKQVSIETMLTMMASGGQKPPPGHNARALYGEFEPKPQGQADSMSIQHLREVAIDHQNGIFAGTNDLIEKIGGRPPTTLEEFINKHRAAFTGATGMKGSHTVTVMSRE